MPFPYVPNSDLLYLSGFHESESLLACVKPRGQSEPRWHLFVQPNCPNQALWDGPRAGVDGARAHILPDGHVAPMAEAARSLASEAAGVDALYFDAKVNPGISASLAPVLRACDEAHVARHSADALVQQLRVRKSAPEAALARASAELCTRAFSETMSESRAAAARGATEGYLAARFEFECRSRGAERLAYPCVVAGGANATTLHYMHNDARLVPGEMVLMDAGASLHGYASDVTRTWPVSGEFSPGQRAVYDAVLAVNRQCIDACRADGSLSLAALHRLSLRWTFEQLVGLGILSSSDARASARLHRYYPHAVGHWLGLDVHDTPAVDTHTPLCAGMLVTVEPGLYFPRDDDQLPEWCCGIGVRIEDDVLIGDDGQPEVLTAGAPKDADEIEALVAAG